MEHNDLGSGWVPRQVFVWENLLAHLPDRQAKREARACRLGRWRRALDCWDWDDLLRRQLVDISWRKSQPVDILTIHPHGFCEALEEHLDKTNYPYNRLYCEPNGLIAFDRRLPFLPEVNVVYHAEADKPFLFGSKGRYIASLGDTNT